MIKYLSHEFPIREGYFLFSGFSDPSFQAHNYYEYDLCPGELSVMMEVSAYFSLVLNRLLTRHVAIGCLAWLV